MRYVRLKFLCYDEIIKFLLTLAIASKLKLAYPSCRKLLYLHSPPSHILSIECLNISSEKYPGCFTFVLIYIKYFFVVV